MSAGILIKGEIGTDNPLEFKVMFDKGTSRIFFLHLVMPNLYYTSEGRNPIVAVSITCYKKRL
mgnify:CR=1 FL=1